MSRTIGAGLFCRHDEHLDRSDSSLEAPGKQQRPLPRDVPPWLLQPDTSTRALRTTPFAFRRSWRGATASDDMEDRLAPGRR